MCLVMEEEVRHLAGERHQQHEGRCPSVGSGRWLLRDRWAERADPEDAAANEREARTTTGKLRVIPAQRAFATRGLGQDDARPLDPELWGGG
jgi:hypothetical protein